MRVPTFGRALPNARRIPGRAAVAADLPRARNGRAPWRLVVAIDGVTSDHALNAHRRSRSGHAGTGWCQRAWRPAPRIWIGRLPRPPRDTTRSAAATAGRGEPARSSPLGRAGVTH